MTGASTPLDDEQYINLETFRKDGSGVKTPVWAAAQDGKLVVMTDGTSHKVKRIRADPKVRAAACDARGTVNGASNGLGVASLNPPQTINVSGSPCMLMPIDR